MSTINEKNIFKKSGQSNTVLPFAIMNVNLTPVHQGYPLAPSAGHFQNSIRCEKAGRYCGPQGWALFLGGLFASAGAVLEGGYQR